MLVVRYPGSKNPAQRQIGDYPAMPLAKARQIAREWREDIAKGIDPKAKAQAVTREAERQRANTFKAAFEAFAQEHLARLRTGDVVKGVIAKHVLPLFGDRPLADITRADGNDLLRAMVKTTPTHANRVRSYLKTFGRWAEEEEKVTESPFANLKRFTKESARDRVLADGEIRAIWQACAKMDVFGRAIRFMLVTGQRRSEVGDAEWREIDEGKKLWTLPRERTKADRAHEVPLSPLAMSILTASPRTGAHVFSTRSTAPISGWSKAKTRLDVFALAELGRIVGDDAGLPEWHLHDLRRTAATHMAALKVDRVVISKVLNHAEGGVTQIYDRHRYEAEKRRALEVLGGAAHCDCRGRRRGERVGVSCGGDAVKKIESIDIPVSRGPLYEAVAMFLGALAYPDDDEMAARFHSAYCRETLMVSARKDSDFAWTPQPIRPVYFLMEEKAAKEALCAGAKELVDRKAAAINTWNLFDQAVSGNKQEYIRAFGTTFENSVGGRAILTNAWLKSKDTNTKNVDKRIINPSRRVIHAARAYWMAVLAAREYRYAGDDDEAEAIVATRPSCFQRCSKSLKCVAK